MTPSNEQQPTPPPAPTTEPNSAPPAAPSSPVGLRDPAVFALWMFYIGIGVILLLVCFPWLSNHFPRTGAATALLLAGFVIGTIKLARRSMLLQVTAIAAVIALIIAVYWIVPTTSGLNFRSATKRLEDLEAAPARDATEFLRRRARAEEAAAEFTDLKSRIDPARTDWASRTMSEGLAEVNSLKREGKLDDAEARLGALSDSLANADIRKTLESRQSINLTLQELSQARQVKAQKERKELAEAQLVQAQTELDALDREKRYDDILDLVGRMNKYKNDLAADALPAFQKKCATTAVRGDLRAVEDLLAANKVDEARQQLSEATKKRSELLAIVGGIDGVPEYGETLRHIWQARGKVAKEELKDLRQQKKYSDIHRLAERVTSEWQFATGTVSKEVTEFTNDCALVCVQAEVEAVDALVEKDQLSAASARLKNLRSKWDAAIKSSRPINDCLVAAHKRVANDGLETARKRFFKAVSDEKYGEVATLRAEVEGAAWRSDAELAGTKDKVQAFLDGCDFVLTLARSAKHPSLSAKP